MAGILSTYKIPQPRGYVENSYYIEDTSPTSPRYFNVDYFPLVMGGGKHVIRLKGNGLNMRLKSKIDVEIIDAAGNNIFCEVQNYRDRFNNYYITVEIYDITAQGIATAFFVGEAVVDLQGNPVPPGPPHEEDRYNVRWRKQFNVLPFERNNAEIIFDKPPRVSVAQVIEPVRQKTVSYDRSYAYTIFTSSINQLTIQSSEFEGYDRDFASSADVLDPRLKAIKVNPLGNPMTSNTVNTTQRGRDNDIEGGWRINHTTRFNTMVTATSSFFIKDVLGGYFEFVSSQFTPQNLYPPIPTNLSVPSNTTLPDLLKSYNATIVEVINDRQVIVDKPLSITLNNSKGLSGNRKTKHTFKKADKFKASLIYVPSDTTYVTSSTVSQSYVELTYYDLNPISGQVHRVKTSSRLGSSTGNYKLLNDHVIEPVEYLTDAAAPNGLNYARHETDYRLIGHFTTQSIADEYWVAFLENPYGFDPIPLQVTSSVQIESIKLQGRYTQSGVVATQYNQNYNDNQTYTLSFYLTLEPYTELEVYLNSDPLNVFVQVPTEYLRGFNKTRNKEKERYSGEYNRFGKYLGKIKNDRNVKNYYGKVAFDFNTDGAGFGRPILRCRSIDQMNNPAVAHIGEVSVKPYTLQGFTPNLVQYTIPLPDDLVRAATLSQSIDFRIDYYDYTGKHAEYSTYLDDVVLNLRTQANSNQCQDDKLYWYFDHEISDMTKKPLSILDNPGIQTPDLEMVFTSSPFYRDAANTYDISLVSNVNSVANWNTFLNPTDTFNFVDVSIGNNGYYTIKLWGGGGCTIPTGKFCYNGAVNPVNILSIKGPAIVSIINDSAFYGCPLTTIDLPSLVSITGNSTFRECYDIREINLPKCTQLGATTGDDNTFRDVGGQGPITAVFNSVLATCDAGSPDGDIVDFATYNAGSLTITYV